MMERLTFEGNFCDIAQCQELPCPYNGRCSPRKVWERLKAYEDTGFAPQAFGVAVRAAELLMADKNGRVVVLPCKVGDTVWAILGDKKYACKCMVEFVNIGSLGTIIVLCKVAGLREQYGVTAASFGKTVFLAKDEAEKALRRAENG